MIVQYRIHIIDKFNYNWRTKGLKPATVLEIFIIQLLIPFSRRLYPEKIGFWVWVLGWVLYPKPKPKNPKIVVPKPKT